MTVVIECDQRFQARGGIFRSRLMTRWWWGWFAVAVLHVPFEEYGQTAQEWLKGSR